jgi:hypothetical protein
LLPSHVFGLLAVVVVLEGLVVGVVVAVVAVLQLLLQ